jgi:hypothetical protein
VAFPKLKFWESLYYDRKKYDKLLGMQTMKFKKIFAGWFLAVLLFSPFLRAQDLRTVPLDMYLIVDCSPRISGVKNEAAAWIGAEIVDRILKDGDSLSLWSAGAKAQLVFSETLGEANGKDAVKAKLGALDLSGGDADFSGALRDAASRADRGSSGRMSYTVLVSASAESLAPALKGKDAQLFRWSKSEERSRFTVLVAAPNIHNQVRRAAAAFMDSGS